MDYYYCKAAMIIWTSLVHKESAWQYSPILNIVAADKCQFCNYEPLRVDNTCLLKLILLLLVAFKVGIYGVNG